MAKLAASGAISADDLRREFGTTTSQSVSLGSYVRGGSYVPNVSSACTGNIPTTTSNISYDNFYGSYGSFLFAAKDNIIYVLKQSDSGDTFTTYSGATLTNSAYYTADSTSVPGSSFIFAHPDSERVLHTSMFDSAGTSGNYFNIRSSTAWRNSTTLTNAGATTGTYILVPNTSTYSASIYNVGTSTNGAEVYQVFNASTTSSVIKTAFYKTTLSSNGASTTRYVDGGTGVLTGTTTSRFQTSATSGGLYVATATTTTPYFYVRSSTTATSFSSKTWNSKPVTCYSVSLSPVTSHITNSTLGGIILYGYDNGNPTYSLRSYYYTGSTVELSTAQPPTTSTTDILPTVMAWDPTGTYLATLDSTRTPSFKILKRGTSSWSFITPDSGYTNLYGRSLAWDSTGTYLAVGWRSTGSGPTGTIEIWKRSGDTFTKVTATGPGGSTTAACTALGWYPPGPGASFRL